VQLETLPDVAADSAAEPVAAIHPLNPAQLAAVHYGKRSGGGVWSSGPLLVIAGAGTGKTNTLAHRVAHLVLNGVAPERLLLLTFSRRAAEEMVRRAHRIVAQSLAAKRGGGSTVSPDALACACPGPAPFIRSKYRVLQEKSSR